MIDEDWLRQLLNEADHLRKQVTELQGANNREVERRRKAERKVKELRHHRESLRTTCQVEIRRRKRLVHELSIAWELVGTGEDAVLTYFPLSLEAVAIRAKRNEAVLEHVKIDWDNIKERMERQAWLEDEPGLEERLVFVGTVMSLTPSGKFYTPWACSNVQVCDKCIDGSDVPCDSERSQTACRDSTGDGLTGEGHCEVCRDAAWKEQFEKEADSKGYFITSGEGDPCDIFVGESREVEDAEA